MKKSWLILAVILTLMLSSSSAFGLQMIVNGDFETGDLTGWNIGGDFPFLGAFSIPNFWVLSHPEYGNHVASVAPPFILPFQAIGTAILYQNFVIPAAMTAAHVDFDYMPWSYDSIEYDFVRIGMFYDVGGALAFDEYVYWGGVDFPGLETPGWLPFHKSYDISGISAPIVCSLAFGVKTTTDNCHPTGLFVDNVSVETTPEPATLLLLGGGLLGMGAIGAIRRRRK